MVPIEYRFMAFCQGFALCAPDGASVSADDVEGFAYALDGEDARSRLVNAWTAPGDRDVPGDAVRAAHKDRAACLDALYAMGRAAGEVLAWLRGQHVEPGAAARLPDAVADPAIEKARALAFGKPRPRGRTKSDVY